MSRRSRLFVLALTLTLFCTHLVTSPTPQREPNREIGQPIYSNGESTHRETSRTPTKDLKAPGSGLTSFTDRLLRGDHSAVEMGVERVEEAREANRAQLRTGNVSPIHATRVELDQTSFPDSGTACECHSQPQTKRP